jgi:hypothetical protein
MPSILLSFVGNQDPFSETTDQEGSIVTLVRHLMDQNCTIKLVFLLHTADTTERAELTRTWLGDAPLQLPAEAIALLPVDSALSDDPVNVDLATQAARQGLDQALMRCTKRDTLELNASSGTPVMKSAWSILQAAGYAPKSRLWQVRNPKEQKAHQARVFQSNIQVLRYEFDLKIITQQLNDFNYSGALTTLQTSGLSTPLLEALLTYGHCRLSLDFRSAQKAIAPVTQEIDAQWNRDITALIAKDAIPLLREAYFNAVIELRNHKYSDFLVRVFQFQEKALQMFVNHFLSNAPSLPTTFDETASFWNQLQTNHAELFQFLETYRYRGNELKLEKFPNRPTLLAILDYGRSPMITPLHTLNAYCEKRNYYIHHFEGISELDGVTDILQTMRHILLHLGEDNVDNPFNHLNQEIKHLLTSPP